MAIKQQPQLGCGTVIDEIWDNMGLGPTSHQQKCPQCRAARESLEALHSVIAAYRQAEATPDDAMRPSPRVRQNILAVARSEVRRGRRSLATVTDRGPVFISDQALVDLVRVAVDTVDGVRGRRIDVAMHTDEGPEYFAQQQEQCRSLRTLTVRLGVRYGDSIPELTAAVRHRVLTVLAYHVDVDPVSVDLVVEDVFNA